MSGKHTLCDRAMNTAVAATVLAPVLTNRLDVRASILSMRYQRWHVDQDQLF
jgi:hypothetical protein